MNTLTGSVVDVITPMREDRSIDYQAFAAFIEWQIQKGSQGICLAGSLGESGEFSPDEYLELCVVAVSSAKGRVPILSGRKGKSAFEAIELAKIAEKAGVSGLIHSVPPDVVDDPDLAFRYCSQIANAVDLPILVSTGSMKCGVSASLSLILRLSEIAQIKGVKDESGDLRWLSEILRNRPKGFGVYSGVDAAAAPFMLLGADGCISTSGNIAPERLAELCAAALDGDARAASRLHLQLFPLYSGIFSHANPHLTKWALHLLGVALPFGRLQGLPTLIERKQVVRAVEQVSLLIPSTVLPT